MNATLTVSHGRAGRGRAVVHRPRRAPAGHLARPADQPRTTRQISLRPWLFWCPFVFIVLISLTVNFIGDGLRDAFDPRQTKVRA